MHLSLAYFLVNIVILGMLETELMKVVAGSGAVLFATLHEQ